MTSAQIVPMCRDLLDRVLEYQDGTAMGQLVGIRQKCGMLVVVFVSLKVHFETCLPRLSSLDGQQAGVNSMMPWWHSSEPDSCHSRASRRRGS